jgi:transcriptional regulator with XRE-family HTH domain
MMKGMVINMKFQEKLYQLRKERKMSQEDLAGVMGVSRQAVQKWEAGTSNPDMDNLIAISEYFGVSLDSLIKGEEEINPDKSEAAQEYVINYPRRHYEYKSKRTLFGLPFVHINVGYGMYKAKGVLAIGNIALGVVSIGAVSMGIISFGALALGLIALAGLGLGGLVFAGLSAGIIAFGGVAIGIFAVGGLAVGIYSMGGVAIASRIAVGGVANGHIAIGDKVNGVITIVISGQTRISAEYVKSQILQEYPDIWRPIVDFIASYFN